MNFELAPALWLKRSWGCSYPEHDDLNVWPTRLGLESTTP
jgi:hypothetical protein